MKILSLADTRLLNYWIKHEVFFLVLKYALYCLCLYYYVPYVIILYLMIGFYPMKQFVVINDN